MQYQKTQAPLHMEATEKLTSSSNTIRIQKLIIICLSMITFLSRERLLISAYIQTDARGFQ